jgi:hypothetical protein
MFHARVWLCMQSYNTKLAAELWEASEELAKIK